MFLLNISYIKSLDQVEPQMKAHGEWVMRYLNEGIFLFGGPKKSGMGGVIGVKSIEKQQLMSILAEDSFVQADVAEYQIMDFNCKLADVKLESLKLA
ncbi:YciI family protein [Solimicrobium silvestre]|uniref:YCII-related domain n=1 Tax=Solimicrobium silvestre TaxID=2099400 RepID=A0A2S9GXE9_9BURK|nr:YciI family protein [Solimicrobium silvestre]PRC92336.1 YCII-related domain [Solimicrobium silvestre]